MKVEIWKTHNRITKHTSEIDCSKSEMFEFNTKEDAINFILADAAEATYYQLLYLVEEPETLNSVACVNSKILNIICDEYLEENHINTEKMRVFLEKELNKAYEDGE